jgi:CheY-like chemotaxis protein
VINEQRVVLGTLSSEALISDPNAAAEQLMEPGPTTIRPNWSFEETSEYLRKQNLDRILVTTSDGRLKGVFFQDEAARRMDDSRAGRSQTEGGGGEVVEERKPRILYADENKDNCDFIVRDLVNYEVTCAMAAVDAVREGKSGRFDLIMLDDRLPGATGIEICREIRAYDRLTPILILSGPDEEAMCSKALDAGAQDYWPSPTDLEAIGNEIRRLIELKRRAAELNQKREAEMNAGEPARESGLPGGGKGRKDVIERTGVFPVSASEGASPDAQLMGQMSLGQGDRGAEGYYDHGDSEIANLDRLSEDLSDKTKEKPRRKAARKK